MGPDLIVRKRESQRPRQASKSKPPPLHSPSLHDRCLNQFSMSQFQSSQCQTLLREFLARLCAEQWYSLVCDWKWGCRTAEHLWPQITWTTSMRPFHQGHQQTLYFGFLPNSNPPRLSTCLIFWIFASRPTNDALVKLHRPSSCKPTRRTNSYSRSLPDCYSALPFSIFPQL